jgi:hypothetical protein
MVTAIIVDDAVDGIRRRTAVAMRQPFQPDKGRVLQSTPVREIEAGTAVTDDVHNNSARINLRLLA